MFDAPLTNTPNQTQIPSSMGTPRNITLNGKRTTVRLDDLRWKSLSNIADLESCRVHDICLAVHETKGSKKSFSDSLRDFIDAYFKSKTAVAMKLKAVKRKPFKRRSIAKNAAQAVTLENSLRKAIGA